MIRRRWLVLAMLAHAGATVILATPKCLVQFATLGSEERRLGLAAAETYAELWQKLGAKAPTELLEAALKGGDPFLIPDHDVDLHSLRKNLKEFRRLLEKGGGDNPEVRARLLEVLRARLGDVKAARERERQAVELAAPDKIFPYQNTGTEYAVSPNGDWLTFIEAVPTGGKDYRLTVIHVPTKQTNYFATEGFDANHLSFTPDGTALLFRMDHHLIRHVPFEQGKPKWAAGRTIGEPYPTPVPLHSLMAGTPPHVVYSTYAGADLFRIDLNEKTMVPADLKSANRTDEYIAGIEAVPFMAGVRLQFRKKNEKFKARVADYAVDEQGKLTLIKDHGPFPMDTWSLLDKPDGSRYFKQGVTVMFNKGDGSPSEVRINVIPRPADEVDVREMKVRPGTNHLYVLSQGGNQGETYLQVFDLETGNQISRRRLAPSTKLLTFSDNGARMVTHTGAQAISSQLTVANPDRFEVAE